MTDPLRTALPTEAIYGPCSCGQARVRESEWFWTALHRGHRMKMAVAIDHMPILDRRHGDRRAALAADTARPGLDVETLAKALWAFHHEAEEGPYDDATPDQREYIHTNAEWLMDYAARLTEGRP